MGLSDPEPEREPCISPVLDALSGSQEGFVSASTGVGGVFAKIDVRWSRRGASLWTRGFQHVLMWNPLAPPRFVTVPRDDALALARMLLAPLSRREEASVVRTTSYVYGTARWRLDYDPSRRRSRMTGALEFKTRDAVDDLDRWNAKLDLDPSRPPYRWAHAFKSRVAELLFRHFGLSLDELD